MKAYAIIHVLHLLDKRMQDANKSIQLRTKSRIKTKKLANPKKNT